MADASLGDMTRRPFAALAIVAVLAGGVAACSAGAGTPDPSPSASGGTQQLLELSRRFAQCGRDHGYPSLPDPEVDDGKVVWPAGQPELKEQLRTLAEEVPQCKALWDQIDSLSGRGNAETPSAEDMPKLRAFAKCMREQGIDGFPDPKPDGTFPLIGTPLENEGKSERVIAAMDACKHLYDKRLAIS